MSNENENQQRSPRQGVFGNKDGIKAPIEPGAGKIDGNDIPKKQPQPEPEKENFKDPFEEQNTGVRERAHKAKQNTDTYSDEAAAKINKSLSGDSADIEDIPIEEADIKLAEKLIFDGYAETDVVMDSFPDSKFTMCSTNAEEMGMIDEVIFDIMKKNETDDGMVDMPQNKIQTLRNAIFVSLGYRGRDGVDLCGEDRSRHLNVIKKGIVRRGDLEIAGKVEETEKINVSLKEAILIRARRVQQLSTPLIDFLSAEKWKFDKKMYKIMTQKGVIPKS